MKENSKSGRVTASFEEVALSSMVLAEALIQLLVEKGVLNRDEVMERVKKVKSETRQVK
jgi:hypothetical protein